MAVSVESLPALRHTLADLRLVDDEDLRGCLERLDSSDPRDLLTMLEREQKLTSLQLSKLRHGDETGYYLGRFKLLYKVSAGTFARVYRAVEPTSGQVMAVKVLRGRYADDQATIDNFHREGRLTDRLNHPNIARTIEVATDFDTGQHYIAMEFVEGGNLREILSARGRIGIEQAIDWTAGMTEGLGHALQHGVTHRDMKPTNILIAATGEVKLVDFGLAGIAESDGEKEVAMEARTVDYAGLEKATGAPKGDPRSDIFFLGCVCYEMISGEPPMEATKDKNARMWRGRFEQIAKLSGRIDAPLAYCRIVDKMAEIQPSARYQTYNAILQDLNDLKVTGDADGKVQVKAQPRIAVVHQSSKTQEALKDKLGRHGYQVVLTSDLTRALKLHALKPVDGFVIDVSTAGRRGMEELRAANLLPRNQSLKYVFMIDEKQKPLVEKIAPARSAAFVKPCSWKPMSAAIRKLVPVGDE